MTLLEGQPPPSPTGNTRATQTDSAGMMGAESLHVLVIGDNPTDRDLIRHHLLGDTCGRYFLREANTGAEGVALCLSAGEQPDCVLLDLHMPDMDGLEAIAALKQGREGLPFPVIVLTDSDEDADRGRQALAMGAQDYLSKSWIGPRSLRRAVNNAIERFHFTQRLHENERKRNEDVLREREAQARAHGVELETLMDVLPAAVLIARDPACAHMTGNHAAREWLRMGETHNASQSAPAHERPGFEVWSNGHRLDPAVLPMQRAAATGIAVSKSECEIVFPDGEKLDLLGSVRPLFDEAGATRGSIGVFLDVSSRKRRDSNLIFLTDLQKTRVSDVLTGNHASGV